MSKFKRFKTLDPGARNGRYLVVAAVILAIGVPSVAIGAGEGNSIIGGERNPKSLSQTLTTETKIIANTSTFGTRQSNKGSGGGAIYGCRSEIVAEACVHGQNLKPGHAFEFITKGLEGGVITIGDDKGVPFTTNAKGVVTNLNADKIDGSDAADFAKAGDLKFAVVTSTATLSSGRGATGATVVGTTFTVGFDANVSKCSYTATPQGDPTNDVSVQPGVDPTTVSVQQSAGPSAFHLQVIC